MIDVDRLRRAGELARQYSQRNAGIVIEILVVESGLIVRGNDMPGSASAQTRYSLAYEWSEVAESQFDVLANGVRLVASRLGVVEEVRS